MPQVNLNINDEGVDLKSVLSLGAGNSTSFQNLSTDLTSLSLKNSFNFFVSSKDSPASVFGGTGISTTWQTTSMRISETYMVSEYFFSSNSVYELTPWSIGSTYYSLYLNSVPSMSSSFIFFFQENGDIVKANNLYSQGGLWYFPSLFLNRTKFSYMTLADSRFYSFSWFKSSTWIDYSWKVARKSYNSTSIESGKTYSGSGDIGCGFENIDSTGVASYYPCLRQSSSYINLSIPTAMGYSFSRMISYSLVLSFFLGYAGSSKTSSASVIIGQRPFI